MQLSYHFFSRLPYNFSLKLPLASLWRRAHARNVSLFNYLRWPIYVFNSVVHTKFLAKLADCCFVRYFVCEFLNSIRHYILTDWLTDYWSNNPADWFTDCLTDWLTEWVSEWLTDWLMDWLTDWLTDRLIIWLIDWLFDWLIVWQPDRLTDWLTKRLADLTTDRLID